MYGASQRCAVLYSVGWSTISLQARLYPCSHPVNSPLRASHSAFLVTSFDSAATLSFTRHHSAAATAGALARVQTALDKVEQGETHGRSQEPCCRDRASCREKTLTLRGTLVVFYQNDIGMPSRIEET
ncbi:hypothetical protein KM043_011139 [Ampulex compressa]|nr:hypothetical protein KM043_011139 [Ampulex compressa]